MSSMVKLKSIPLFFALSLHRFSIIFLNESPKAKVLLMKFFLATFLRLALFSGLLQYCFSYSFRFNPVAFICALERLAHNLEQKCRDLFLYQQKRSVLFVPHKSQLNVMVDGMVITCGQF